MEWDWQFIITTAVAAGVGSAVFSAIGAWWNRRKAGTYLALRLAIILEEFARDCLRKRSAIDLNFDTGGTFGSLPVGLPDIAAYPNDDDGWRAIPIDLAEQALSFHTLVEDSDYRIQDHGEQLQGEPRDQNENLAAFAAVQMVERALEAVQLAALLRHRYDYKQNDGEWVAALRRHKKLDDEAAEKKAAKYEGSEALI